MVCATLLVFRNFRLYAVLLVLRDFQLPSLIKLSFNYMRINTYYFYIEVRVIVNYFAMIIRLVSNFNCLFFVPSGQPCKEN